MNKNLCKFRISHRCVSRPGSCSPRGVEMGYRIKEAHRDRGTRVCHPVPPCTAKKQLHPSVSGRHKTKIPLCCFIFHAHPDQNRRCPSATGGGGKGRHRGTRPQQVRRHTLLGEASADSILNSYLYILH